jgi:hypothetical protein
MSQSLNNQPSNPIPTTSTISPTSAVDTGAAFTLTVNGTNFVASSVVNFAGVARTTTFVSATQLTAAIPAAAIATAGTAAVTVTNPSPGGGTSDPLTFTITATNPTPTITTISPTSAAAGGAAFTLTVNGTNFVASSVVDFAGVAGTITAVSATQLTVAIPAATIATAGTAAVTVTNPAPGGGTSNAVNFFISAPGPAWVSTGTMSFQRFGHTATLLVDGQVLVAGGAWNGAAPCEIYNPSTHGWTTTGTMNTSARALHTATLLQNGKVLVAGGSDQFPGFSATATAELFDPSTGAWTSTAPMTEARAYHKATMLPDGRVLVSGGIADQTAEIYDPTTETWARTPNMQYMRSSHASTLLPNGRVLVAQGGYSTVAEEYDPTTGAWNGAGTVPTVGSPSDLTATLLLDGTVLTAGGCYGYQADFCLGTIYPDADLFTPTTLVWAGAKAFMSTARTQHTATLLGDGRVLVAGSQEAGVIFSDNFQLNSAELYDPATSSWSAAPSMIVGRSRHTATLLNDKTVLVVGGVTDIYCDDIFCSVKTVTSSAELFTP